MTWDVIAVLIVDNGFFVLDSIRDATSWQLASRGSNAGMLRPCPVVRCDAVVFFCFALEVLHERIRGELHSRSDLLKMKVVHLFDVHGNAHTAVE